MSPPRTLPTCTLIVAFLAAPLTAQEPVTAETPPPEGEKIVADVNGATISEAELADAVRRQLRGREVDPEAIDEIQRLILDSLINRRLVEQFLADKKITVNSQEVDAVIQGIKERVSETGLTFAEALKFQGQTEESLRARIAGQIAFRSFAETEVTDEKLKEHFTAHKQEFDGTEFRASHILIQLAGKADEKEKKAALAKIQAIRQEVVKGQDFAAAAKKYSGCPSAQEGGDLGFFPRRGAMVEPFAAAAFALKQAEISQPVETPFGWHLIKVTDRKPGDQRFEEARDAVKGELYRGLWENAAAAQRKNAKIEIRL